MIKPINDGVLIREIKPEETTEAGIILEKTKPKHIRNGAVLAVGEGHRMQDGNFAALSVNDGDKVMYKHIQGNEVEVDGEKLQLCRELDIVGVVEEKYQPPQAYREVPGDDPELKKLWEENITILMMLN